MQEGKGTGVVQEDKGTGVVQEDKVEERRDLMQVQTEDRKQGGNWNKESKLGKIMEREGRGEGGGGRKSQIDRQTHGQTTHKKTKKKKSVGSGFPVRSSSRPGSGVLRFKGTGRIKLWGNR